MRRGIQFAEDVRFCFTVYEDNEQAQPGDTLNHTWYKRDWPPCTTKWLYFWGYITGLISPSTSPLFKYHHPTEPPELMETVIVLTKPTPHSVTLTSIFETEVVSPPLIEKTLPLITVYKTEVVD